MAKRRVDLDQYFTSPNLVNECLAVLSSKISLDDFDLIIEPCAGSGRFLDQLPTGSVIALDIAPKDPRVGEADFLTFYPEHSRKILVIGNPPFGQRGALAIQFLNHAMKFSHTVAMILPRSFNKFTFINRVDRHFTLEESVNLSGFFDFDGHEVEVQTVFQIWQKSSEIRSLLTPDRTHPDFSMRHAHLSRTDEMQRQALIAFADLALPQVGAHFRPSDPSTLTKGSHWFIRLNPSAVPEAFHQLDFSFLEGTNTAHTSLSKADIVRAYLEACNHLGKSRETAVGTDRQLKLL
jgi:predicted RNA methylase